MAVPIIAAGAVGSTFLGILALALLFQVMETEETILIVIAIMVIVYLLYG